MVCLFNSKLRKWTGLDFKELGLSNISGPVFTIHELAHNDLNLNPLKELNFQ